MNPGEPFSRAGLTSETLFPMIPGVGSAVTLSTDSLGCTALSSHRTLMSVYKFSRDSQRSSTVDSLSKQKGSL